MWWYELIDVLIWVACGLLTWKAIARWRGNKKLRLPGTEKSQKIARKHLKKKQFSMY